MLVRFCMRPAGPMTNETPTAMSRNATTKFMKPFILFPRYFAVTSGMFMPPVWIDIIPAKKSCTAPMKMQPTTIHMYAAGPKAAPVTAPKIGPRPAMLRNWITKTFHVDIG